MFLELGLKTSKLLTFLTVLVVLNCQKTDGKTLATTVSTVEEPDCADLYLYSELDNHRANFSLQSGEQSYTKYTDLVSEQFLSGDYSLTVKTKWGCTFLACTKNSLRCNLLNNGYEPFEVNETNPVQSVFCQCEWLNDNCPFRPDCVDESEDILKAGQCGRGYQQLYCGKCPLGYLSMLPGDVIPTSHPQHDISSLTLRKDCRLWAGDKWMDQLFGNVKIDPNVNLICNCSEDYIRSAEMPANTTDFIDPRSTNFEPQDYPNTAWIPYLIVGLSFCVIFVISIAIMYKYKMRQAEKLRLESRSKWFNGDLCNFEGKVIPPEEIKIIKELSSGKFGVVRLAEWKSANADDVKKCVLKTAKESKSNLQMVTESDGCRAYNKLLVRESHIFSHIGDHENIAKMLGVFKSELTAEESLVLEYYENQDLYTYLRNEENRSKFVNMTTLQKRWIELKSCRVPEDSASFLFLDRLRSALEPGCFSTLKLLHWARDIATALEFLVSKKVLHLDLAARNILIGSDFVARLGDFGLARILEGSDYFRMGAGDYANPLEWVAPDAAEHFPQLVFSISTEVWAYGVVVWEIFSLGDDPYPEIETNVLHEKLRDGYRMEMPIHANEATYQQILNCWTTEPNQRPSIQSLKLFFEDEATALENLMKSITADAESLFCTPSLPPKSYLKYDDVANNSLSVTIPESEVPAIEEFGVPQPNSSANPHFNESTEQEPSTSTIQDPNVTEVQEFSMSATHEPEASGIQDSITSEIYSDKSEIQDFNICTKL